MLLKYCIQFGHPVLIEDVDQNIDSSLYPLLLKQTFQQNDRTYVKIGDSIVEYSSNFR